MTTLQGVTKRFIEMADNLIKDRVVKNDTAFCKSMGFSPQSWSQIRTGKWNITVEMLAAIVKKFNTNSYYILTGKGAKFCKTSSKPDTEAVAAMEKVIMSKQDLIDVYKKLVANLESEIRN